MAFRAQIDLMNDQSCEELPGPEEVLQLLGRIPWENELVASAEAIHFPSVEILSVIDRKLLTITALESSSEHGFMIELRNAGKLARWTTGTLINDTSYARVVEITKLFCGQQYQEIGILDNAGLFSKLLRGVIFVFASDDDDELLQPGKLRS